MTATAIEILKTVGLLDKQGRVSAIGEIPPIELQRMVEYYSSKRQEYLIREVNIIKASQHGLSALISSTSATNAVLPLMPSCMIYNKIIANDPLFKYGTKRSEMSRAFNQFLGMDSQDGPDAKVIERKLLYFEKMRPLIEDGHFHVLPIETLHAQAGNGVPVFFSEDYFRSEVPRHIHDYIHSCARIKEMRPVDGGGLVVLPTAPAKPGRGIYIEFEDDADCTNGAIYLLHEQKIIEWIDESHVRFAQTLPWDKPPSVEMFETWVYQSINRTIINRIGSVAREVSLSDHLGLRYVTESKFESTFCGMCGTPLSDDTPHSNAVKFLDANIGVLACEDPALIAKLRDRHSEQFERWRSSLFDIGEQLTGYQGDFDSKSKALYEREVRPQLDELNANLIKAVAGGVGGTLLTAGTIGMALLSSAAIPFAAVLGLGSIAALGRTVPSAAEYLSGRNGPAFIWSKVSK